MTNYITIYEAEASTSIYIPISSIVFLFLEIMVIAISVTIWRRQVFSTRILLLFLMLFIGFLMFCSIYQYIDVRMNITDKYIDGNFEIVEGRIYNYEAVEKHEQGTDYFYVDNVMFTLSSFTGYGYNVEQRDGGVLKNGMSVKIYYVPYKYENVMMRVELLESS